MSMLQKIMDKMQEIVGCQANFVVFFLSGFSFTNIHESQDCRGRGRAFL